MKKVKEKKLDNARKSLNTFISNITRVLLVLILIRGFIVGDHSQDFLIVITFALTYYPSILSKKFGVYLPKRLQLTITLFIFASIDPVAVDQACYDAVVNAKDEGKKALIERMDSRHGIHTVEAANKLGLGSREYEIINI